MILRFTRQLRNDLFIMTIHPANDTLVALLKDKTDFAIARDYAQKDAFKYVSKKDGQFGVFDQLSSVPIKHESFFWTGESTIIGFSLESLV